MKNLLYITPHLSTGGAPQYLFKKIELLNEIYNIYVLEYNDHGHYRVQKNKIINLLGERHKTLGENKEEIFDFIKNSNPNIIHFVEMPEFFMHDHISKIIYSNDRPYKIFETSHDSSFNPNNKKFFPDKILFCSDNQVKIFKDLNIPSCVIEYPVYDKQVNKKEYTKKLELDPNFKHVLNVGLFTSRKNQGEIFEYARMMQEYPIKFHFVGNMAPNFKDYWEPLLSNKPENCIVWGERSDTSNFYSGSFEFDGSGDGISTPDNTDFEFGGGDFTVECWVKQDDTSGFDQFVGKYGGSSDGEFIVGKNGNTPTFYWQDSGGNNNINATNFTGNTNSWYHMACVREGNEFTMYINGVCENSTTDATTIKTTSNKLTVGIENDS